MIASVSYPFILENVTISKVTYYNPQTCFTLCILFFKYVAFSFLSLSFLSPNLEPMEYQEMLYVPVFNMGVCDKTGKRAKIE